MTPEFRILQESDPSAAEIRSASRSILESEAFRFGPQPESSWIPWLLRKIRAWLESLGDLRETMPAVYWSLLAACILALTAIFAHAGWILWRALRTPRQGRLRAKRMAAQTTAVALMDEARRAAAGNAAAALSLYLRAIVTAFDERGVQPERETATVREVLRLLRGVPREHLLFSEFLGYYEPGVFGRQTMDPASMESCDRLVRSLILDRS